MTTANQFAHLAYEWDFGLLVVLMSVILYGIIRIMNWRWKSTHDNRGMKAAIAAVAFITAGILCGGWILIHHAEKQEYERTKGILISNAPILAYELSKQGHGELGFITSDNDSRYLKMIQSMVDWMSLNRQINSIYTMRKLEVW